MKKLLQKIFAVKNENEHIIIVLFGLKFKFNIRSSLSEKSKNFIQKLFYIKYVNNRKVFNILGIKIKKLKQTTIQEICKANAITHTHQITFSKYKFKHVDDNIFIIASGPTLNYFNKPPKGIYIGMNQSYQYQNIVFDYYFTVHFSEQTNNYLKEVSYLDITKFYGRYLNESLVGWAIPEEYFRLMNIHKYYVNTNSDSYFYPDIDLMPLKNGGSVAFHALQFALYTYPKRIFLIGCDCSVAGYFDSNTKQNQWYGLNETLNTYPRIKEFASKYYPNTEIISVNPVGLKGLFRDVYTRDYINANPEIFEHFNGKIEYFEDVVKEEANV